MTPFERNVWNTLEAAKDNGDEMVIAACRRLIVAFRLGFRKHAQSADVALIHALAA